MAAASPRARLTVWVSVLNPTCFMIWPNLNYSKGTGKTWVWEERLLLEKRV